MWRYRQPGVAFQLLGELQRQQHCNILCDTVLQTEGMSVPVHSCILAAFSPFLYRELSTPPSYPVGQRRLIRVPAIGAEALLKLISYLYSGEMKGLGPREHEEVKAAFIRLGMSHLIHTFEEDSRQWRGVDRGLQLELEGSVQVGAEQRSAGMQTAEGKGVDKATQTEAESTAHAATQTSRRDAHALSDQWPSPSSDGHGSAASSATQFAEVSPTARASTFVILTPVSDPPLSNDNAGSCHVSLMPSPSVQCDHPPPYSVISNPSNAFNPFERLSGKFSSTTARPDDSVESISQGGKERASTHVEAGTVGEPGPEEHVSKDDTDEASSSKVRRSERLMTMKERPGQDAACTSEEPEKVLKIKFKRKCKNALWEIERMTADPAMKVTLSMSSATTLAQKDLTACEEWQNGSSVLTPPHDPRLSSPSKFVVTSVHTLTPTASRRTSPSVQNKAAPSPTHSQPEECDEQMDKLLDDIMMDLNFLLPINTERGDSRSQQRPLPYLSGDTSGLDPTPWLREVSMEVSMVNGHLDRSSGQMDKAVGSDLSLVSHFGTSLAESVESEQSSSNHPGSKSTPCHVEPRNGSSCRFTQVKSAKTRASTGSPESGGNAGLSNAELSLSQHGWPSWRKLPSPNPISKEPKRSSTATYRCTPDLDEMRLRSCLSPLRSEDESTVGSQRLQNQPTGQSATSGQRSLSQQPVNIPPWLSLKPVDLRFPLNSIFVKSPSQTDEAQCPAVKRTRRQKTLLAQNIPIPGSETYSGSSISRQKASRIEEDPCVRSIVTRKQSLERQRSVTEPENQSLRKGPRRLVAKRKLPVEENDHKTSAGASPGLGLQNTDSNARHSSTLVERRKGRRSPPAFANRKEDLPEVARPKQGGGHAKSVADSKSLSSPEIPKRKRGRPPKPKVPPGVLSPTSTTLTAMMKARPHTPAPEAPGSRQRTSSKNRQGQEDNIDSSAKRKAVMENQCAEANNVQRNSLASSSELKPTPVADVKCSASSTPTSSQTLKRFRELLKSKGLLIKKRKTTAEVEEDVQNSQCREDKEMSTTHENIKSAETDETAEQTTKEAPMKCHLNRHLTYPAIKGDTDSQQAPPQRISAKPGAKASRARKWTEGSTGSGDEDEEDQEEDVDVMSGSPVTLPVFESGLVGREPSDVEDIDEDVDIITVDID